MKQIVVLLVLAAGCLLVPGNAHAAFAIKPAYGQHELATNYKYTSRTEKPTGSANQIPEVLYIVLSIFPFGGAVAIGLNTDFTGYDWITAALLYVLFYLPGLIYALIKLPEYYSGK